MFRESAQSIVAWMLNPVQLYRPSPQHLKDVINWLKVTFEILPPISISELVQKSATPVIKSNALSFNSDLDTGIPLEFQRPLFDIQQAHTADDEEPSPDVGTHHDMDNGLSLEFQRPPFDIPQDHTTGDEEPTGDVGTSTLANFENAEIKPFIYAGLDAAGELEARPENSAPSKSLSFTQGSIQVIFIESNSMRNDSSFANAHGLFAKSSCSEQQAAGVELEYS